MELLISDSVIVPSPYEIRFSAAAKTGAAVYLFKVAVYPRSGSFHIHTESETPLNIFEEFIEELILLRPALGWMLGKN